jgi:DNA-binding MurR/RpiR family transcriptional regulator
VRYASFAALQDAISALYSTLTAQEQVVADAIVRRPSDVAVMSMRKFANANNASPYTAIRLFKKLGLPSYEPIRVLALEALRDDPVATIEQARAVAAASGAGAAMLGAQLSLVVSATRTPSEEEIDRVARILARAKIVYVIGFRTSQSLAQHFHYCGQHVHKNLLFLSGEGGTPLEALANIGPDDAAFVLSFRPYAAMAVRLCHFARSRGARIVALTDNKLSPLHRLADDSLFVAADGPSYFNSLVGPVIVVERLLARMFDTGDAACGQRRKRVQALQHFIDRGRA